jgi:dihydroflavonol-4-reductase
MESGKEVVLITGITGYLGSHVGKVMIDKAGDKYQIRASVRSLANKNKLEPLKKAFGEDNFNNIEFVEADLSNGEQLVKAIEGCSYIIHVANPVPGQ